MKVRITLAAVALASLAFGVAAQSAGSATPPPLTVEDMLKPAAYAGPVLSRNGRHFAVTVPINGRRNLAVIDLETRNGVALTNYRDFDVLGVTWVGNERLLYTLGQANSPTGPGQFDGGGLFMVSRDGKESRKLSATVKEQRQQRQFVHRGYELLRTVPTSDDEVIVRGNIRSAEAFDLYRMNVVTGRATLLTHDRPEHAAQWLLDRNLVPRVVTSWIRDTTTYVVWYRKGEDAEWTELTRYDRAKGPTFVPLAFESDNQTLQIAFNGGRDTMAVYRYDPNAKKLGAAVAEHPRFDLGADAAGDRVPGVITDWKTDEIVGYAVRADKPELVWTDPAYQRLQRMVDGALPGMINRFTRTPDGKRLVVTSLSDRQPARWYMLDEEKKTLEELFDSRPWIKPGQMVEQRSFRYRTRDGLEIPGYYFLPHGYKPGDRLPTVVHIHGGPGVRADTYGNGFGVFEAQILAARGYAVVLPNFRITPGFGGQIYYAGFGQFGRAMVDDHEDATKWAIGQGFADPERICISGASYGGYAVLMSLARFPALFRCGIAGLSVSDPELLLTSPAGDIPYSKAGVAFWNQMIGVDGPFAVPAEIKPVTLASRIRQPVMFYAGADDIRTPREQTDNMVRALERAGNPPKKVIVKAEEGHGYGRVENNVDLYKHILEFLDVTIGAKSRPSAQ